MYDEDDLLPIAALQHLAFCERQCALIYIEQVWADNSLTVSGAQLHDKAHEAGSETRGGVRSVRDMALRSLSLGLIGKADLVEFHVEYDDSRPFWEAPQPVTTGASPPVPVEYKHGKPKPTRCDEVQVCAQGLCLEEMMGLPVPYGFLYYGKTHHRHRVEFDAGLRAETRRLAERLHQLVKSGVTPPAVAQAGCRSCSLADLCLPKAPHAASRYLARAIEQAIQDGGKNE